MNGRTVARWDLRLLPRLQEHDVFTVFSAELLSGEPTASEHDDDVTEVAWVPVEQASQRMPWYPDGVEALLRAGGAGHSAARG